MSQIRLNGSGSLYDGGYSYSVTVPPGSTIYTAGISPLDTDGTTVGPNDVTAQANQCMINLETALDDAGASLTDVVKVTIYVAEKMQADLVVAWDVVSQVFGDHKPAATLVGVTVLGYDDQLVEIEAIAAVPA
ncbi:RidA family protein [Jongsikchunia kroppenstedtii]|uniref:RidA family protein n=1 Tax=Jongsikchunia kroppenstedtii TaxID=1121721 RepID=UPI00038072CF|nr:Rid family hydrolase [Jongsikchunia kroppenstedtii]